MDGKEVVSSLREWTAIPVIVLTAREQRAGENLGSG